MGMTAWQAGQRITAARLNQLTPRWQAWTPVWSTSTGVGTPSFGNSSVTCSYCQTGDIVFLRMEIGFGATTNFGTGGGSDNYRFSIPVTASGTSLVVGTGEVQDVAPTSIRYPLRGRLTSTTTLEFELSGGSSGGAAYASTGTGLIDAVTPHIWASGDSLRFWGHYQAA